MSDHSPVQCTLHIQNIKLCSAYWHYNTHFLEKLLFFYGVHIKRISQAFLKYSGVGISVKVLSNTFISSILAMSPSISPGLFKTKRQKQ